MPANSAPKGGFEPHGRQASARTLPRHASLNFVPLPQPRGHGNPILRFLQQRRSARLRGVVSGVGPFAGRLGSIQRLGRACRTHAPLAFVGFQEFLEAVAVVAGGFRVALSEATV